MSGEIDRLAAVVAAHLREWSSSPAFVELAIFGCEDADFIAGTLDAFCLRNLGSPVAAGLFHQSSIGKLFDFAATARGAEWIDEVAASARERMNPVGGSVIGHGDWRAEHVRFLADKPVVAFDWDSLCREREPALVGAAAHGFCADWTQDDNPQAPSLDEARAFVRDYERARGRMFSAEERRLCGACLAYACAYTARCGHAVGGDARATPGSFQHLVWSERGNLFDI